MFTADETVQLNIAIALDFGQHLLPIQFTGEMVLGRRAEGVVDLSAFDAQALGVSRLHAALSADSDGLVIEDRGSDEGTRLNGRLLVPFRRYAVQDGDCIQLGGLAFILRVG